MGKCLSKQSLINKEKVSDFVYLGYLFISLAITLYI